MKKINWKMLLYDALKQTLFILGYMLLSALILLLSIIPGILGIGYSAWWFTLYLLYFYLIVIVVNYIEYSDTYKDN